MFGFKRKPKPTQIALTSPAPSQQLVVAAPEQSGALLPAYTDHRTEKIKTVIAAGESFEGSMKLRNGIKVDGLIQGEVLFGTDDGMLVVSHTGLIIGDIVGPKAIIQGEVRGNIKITGRAIIMKTARISGDIIAGSVQVQEGAQIAGRLCPITDLQPDGPVLSGEAIRQTEYTHQPMQHERMPPKAQPPHQDQQAAVFHFNR